MHIEPNANSPASRALLARAAALVGAAMMAIAGAASAGVLDRIRESGEIRLGYYADANPFSFSAGASKADGYGMALCNQVAEAIQHEFGIRLLGIDVVSVPFDPRFKQILDGKIDILCTPVSVTLNRRKDISFSIPVFPGGVRAVVSYDASAGLREALSEAPSSRVVWRGSPAAKVLDTATFGVVQDTAAKILLSRRLATFQVGAKLVPLPDYRAGLQQVSDKKVDVFFGDRALILGAMNSETRTSVKILERRLTHEPFALALPRGDEDFRLAVDEALSKLFRSDKFRDLYLKWFDEFDDATRTFFLWTALE